MPKNSKPYTTLQLETLLKNLIWNTDIWPEDRALGECAVLRAPLLAGYPRTPHVNGNRKMWEMLGGPPLLPHEFVLHKCDHPFCMRPTHLYKGSAADNRRDVERRKRRVMSPEMVLKLTALIGLLPYQPKRKGNSTKISDRRLRRMFNDFFVKKKSVAFCQKKYGYSNTHTRTLLRREQRRHV